MIDRYTIYRCEREVMGTLVLLSMGWHHMHHHALLAAYRAKNLLPYARNWLTIASSNCLGSHTDLANQSFKDREDKKKLRKRSYSCSESPRFGFGLTLPSIALAVLTLVVGLASRSRFDADQPRDRASDMADSEGDFERFTSSHPGQELFSQFLTSIARQVARHGPAQLYIVSHMGHVSKVTFVSLEVIECTALHSFAFIRVVDPGSRRF